MRTTVAVSLSLVLMCSAALAVTPGDDLLQKGRDEFHDGKYAEAAKDLRAAADAYISTDQLSSYVNSGHLAALPQFETALVYLTLSYAKLGREAEARDALRRLHVGEQIEPTYQGLPLEADAADFESVAQKLTPDMPLPPNQALADLRSGKQRRSEVAQAQPAPPQLAPPPKLPVQPTIAAERAVAEKAAAEKIAADRAAAEQAAQQKIAAGREQAQRETAERVAAAEADAHRTISEQLRLANADALSGRLTDANTRYVRLLDAPNVSREVVAAAGTGLYRTGDFQDALRAFQKLGTFAKGEEDLRYYHSVALFETGRYEEANKELACALPFIQLTDDVTRYRTKIESMASQQAMK